MDIKKFIHTSTSLIVALTMTVSPFASNMALANSFEAGKSMGNAATQSIYSGVNQGAIDSLPSFGATTNDTSTLQGYYPGNGKDSVGAIQNLMTQGSAVANETCSATDYACKARRDVSTRDTNKTNKYKGDARQMLSTSNDRNPLDVLGLNVPNITGGGEICNTVSVTTPPRSEESSCLDATLQRVAAIPKLPASSEGHTSPYCIGTEFPYKLVPDRSFCDYTWYSCPSGGVLNGATCTFTEYKDTIPGSTYTYRAGHWEASPIRDNNYPRFGAYTIEETGTWGLWTGTNCLVPSQNGQGGYAFPPTVQTCSSGGRWTAGYVIPPRIFNKGDHIQWESYGGTHETRQATGKRLDDGSVIATCPDGFTLHEHGFCEKWTPHSIRVNLNGTTIYDGVRIHDGNHSNLVSIGRTDGFSCSSGYERLPGDNSGTCVSSAPCQTGYKETAPDVCTLQIPATAHYETTSAGCLGNPAPIYQTGLNPNDYTQNETPQMLESEVKMEYRAGRMTCVTEYYSCPAGMYQNGALCESVKRMEYEKNPKCVNLGYNPSAGEERYLCYHDEGTDCDKLSHCTETSKTCIYYDEIAGSPTRGQCLAWDKRYKCPVPGMTTVSETCGFEPICINGNCFEEEDPCAELLPEGALPSFASNDTCELLTMEDFFFCGVDYEYSKPDEKGERHIIGAKPKSNCQYLSKSECTMLPLQIQTHEDGSTSWPTQAEFSCLGDTLNTCISKESNPNCTYVSQKVKATQFGVRSNATSSFASAEGYTIPGAKPTVIQKTFRCETKASLPPNSCTRDFAMVAAGMETSRQAGTYLDPANIRVFSGEFHRCDYRTWGGWGGKDCCDISAPDPHSNADVIGNDISSALVGGLINAGVSAGSNYVFDFMMQSETFGQIAGDIAGSSLGSVSGLGQGGGTQLFSYAGVGMSWGAPATGYSTLVAGGAGGSGGLYLTFSPVGFAIFVAIQMFQMYQSALACDQEDYKTATLNKGKLCYSYGTWCDAKGMLGCEKYRTGWCCFNSKLARIINEQGRKQLGMPMNQCDGFSIDQLGQLDWSKIDLSEFIADILAQAQSKLPKESDIQMLNERVKGTVSGGQPGVQPIDSLDVHP